MSLTNRARLLYGSPLSRPRTAVPIVIGLAVIIAFGVSAYIRELSPVKPVGLQIYFIALAASLLLSLAPLAILWFLDRREPESRWLYLIAVFWGAFIAFELVLPFNNYIFRAVASFVKVHPGVQVILGPNAGMMIAAPLSGPPVEEALKGLGVLLLFWLLRAEFDNVRDGFIYGALVGIAAILIMEIQLLQSPNQALSLPNPGCQPNGLNLVYYPVCLRRSQNGERRLLNDLQGKLLSLRLGSESLLISPPLSKIRLGEASPYIQGWVEA